MIEGFLRQIFSTASPGLPWYTTMNCTSLHHCRNVLFPCVPILHKNRKTAGKYHDCVSKMSYCRNALWLGDESIKRDLAEYSRQGVQRKEMLSFVSNDFNQYAWSLRTLDRRLREFGLYHTDSAA